MTAPVPVRPQDRDSLGWGRGSSAASVVALVWGVFNPHHGPQSQGGELRDVPGPPVMKHSPAKAAPEPKDARLDITPLAGSALAETSLWPTFAFTEGEIIKPCDPLSHSV